MAAQIVGHEPELVGQRALVLLGPAEMVLRPAVNEQDRRPVRPAPLAHVQPQAAAAPHRVNLHPSASVDGLCDCCHLSPPRLVGRRDRGHRGLERIGRRALSFARRPTVSRPRARSATPSSGGRAILAGMEARASEAFVGRVRELEELERVLDATRAGQRCDRPRHRRSRHRQDPARLRAREHVPATRASRSSSDARSTSSARSCRISRSSRPCVRWEILAGSIADGGLAAAGVRGDARPAHRASSRRTRAARARGSALGRYLDARPRRLPRAQPRRPAGAAARDLP